MLVFHALPGGGGVKDLLFHALPGGGGVKVLLFHALPYFFNEIN